MTVVLSCGGTPEGIPSIPISVSYLTSLICPSPLPAVTVLTQINFAYLYHRECCCFVSGSSHIKGYPAAMSSYHYL